MADKELWDDLVLDASPSNTDRLVKQTGASADFDSVQLDNIGAAKFTVTAAGDIIYATASETLARLAAGTSGQVLTMNDLATAPQWSTSQGLSVGDIQEVELYSETLASAGQFDVSSISQDYDHLKLYLQLRTDVSAISDGVKVKINNDGTGTNYRYQRLNAQVTTVSANVSASLNNYGDCAADNSPTGSFTTFETLILNYTSTSKNKLLKTQFFSRFEDDAGDGEGHIGFFATEWMSTAALNRINIYPDGYPTDGFMTGSYMQIIGVKTVS